MITSTPLVIIIKIQTTKKGFTKILKGSYMSYGKTTVHKRVTTQPPSFMSTSNVGSFINHSLVSPLLTTPLSFLIHELLTRRHSTPGEKGNGVGHSVT